VFTLIYKGEPYVIVNISEDGAAAALNALGRMMDGGSIELLSDTGNVLAVLRLSNPAAEEATGSELVFNTIREADAVAYGTASSARILSRDGSEIFSCDCGDLQSDAVIKLNPVQITRGAPVRLDSFKLAMP
jgi:hypothetical protein